MTTVYTEGELRNTRMTNDLNIRSVLAVMSERFASANSVPVERVMIKRDEWDMVTARMSLLECRVAALAALHYGAPDAQTPTEMAVDVWRSLIDDLKVADEPQMQADIRLHDDPALVYLGPHLEPRVECPENIEWRDCEIAFNAIQNYLGSETAHLKPAEQYHVFKRVARSLEKDCDEMVREAASDLNREAPR